MASGGRPSSGWLRSIPRCLLRVGDEDPNAAQRTAVAHRADDRHPRGRDVGLAIALAALTAERARQETMAAHRVKHERGRYVYAEGVLLDVSKVVARRFRQ
jgi:hypothetical protein